MEKIELTSAEKNGSGIATVCDESDLGYIMVSGGSKKMHLRDQVVKSSNKLFTECACDVFASILSEKYGYSICEIQNLDDLSHVFCVRYRNGIRYEIDVTGEHPENYFYKKYNNPAEDIDLASLRDKNEKRYENGKRGLAIIVERARAEIDKRSDLS